MNSIYINDQFINVIRKILADITNECPFIYETYQLSHQSNNPMHAFQCDKDPYHCRIYPDSDRSKSIVR